MPIITKQPTKTPDRHLIILITNQVYDILKYGRVAWALGVEVYDMPFLID
jgi:hypothetical protein